jgi:pimeloyl-ACP methyl ester carboxylesterase
MARLGHAVVTVSLVGYGNTVGEDFPQGNLVCQGGNADAISQVVAHLKSGSYTFGGAPSGPAFDRVAIFGSSFGGQYVQVAAYSFDNIDALVSLGWADPILPSPVGVQFTGSTALTCFLGGERKYDDGSGPNGYVLRPGDLAVGVQWTDAEPEAEDFWIRSMERDPCGNQTSIPARFVADLSGLSRIKMPVLVVDGTGDELVGWIAPRILFDRLTGTTDKTLMLFPGAGHSFFLERRRAEWTRRISGWLKERGY